MIPYIQIFGGKISSYGLMAAAGVLALVFSVHLELRKTACAVKEENFIYPRIVVSGMAAWFCSVIFDTLFKIRENGGFVISGSTFYGGLIGAAGSLYVLLKTAKGRTDYSITEWYDILTVPLILFHFFGRVGCFLGGCCYGKETASILGLRFPDNAEYGIFHNGEKCYPTQLFEAAALLIICIIILHVKHRFECYLLLYAAARFFIEFFRGDDRGYVLSFLSPAQMVSVLILLCLAVRRMGIRAKSYCNPPHKNI